MGKNVTTEQIDGSDKCKPRREKPDFPEGLNMQIGQLWLRQVDAYNQKLQYHSHSRVAMYLAPKMKMSHTISSATVK